MRKLLSKYWPIFVLLLLLAVVGYRNVSPGTYLTGWDNLHPEFDFRTNIFDRSLKGVWQYYQGLGVPSGNAHVADLPRQVVLWIVSSVVPDNLIRYGYHLLAWFVGGVGVYALLFHQLLGGLKYRRKQVVALVGSVFYLFNLGTLQNFYAPYEAFSHFFLMLPWLMLVMWRYLQEGNKVRLWQLVLVNIVAVPMAYIPTVFVVYLLVMGVVWGVELTRSKLKSMKWVLVAGSVILMVNMFWLLPFGHFVLTGTKGVVSSKINTMFTEEAFLRNQEFGSLDHSLLLEGFWFDTTDLVSGEGEHDYLMRPWIDYLGNPGVREVMWGLVGVVGIGMMYGLISRKQYSLELVILGVIGLFALINDNYPTGDIFRYLQENVPLFRQVLRFPYTKLIVVVVMIYSVFVAWAMELTMRLLRKFGYLVVGVCIGAVMFVQWPVFQGNLFYSELRIEIPQEYFELFEFFQNEDRYRGRIANLPQPTFWGWTSYEWGYRGSGFPWYGIPQPILDRNFDVWSPEGEKYYKEISHAIYDNEERELFADVLGKYGIDYVWIDGWVINPHKPKLLDMSQVEVWLEESGYREVFNAGRQVVYKRNEAVIQTGIVIIDETSRWDGYPVVELGADILATGEYFRYGDQVITTDDLPTQVVERDDGKKLYEYEDSEMEYIRLTDIIPDMEYDLLKDSPGYEYDVRTWWMKEMFVEYESEKGEEISICLKRANEESCYYIGVDVNDDEGYRWGKFELAETTDPAKISILVQGNLKVKSLRFGVFSLPKRESSLTVDETSDDAETVINIVRSEVEAKNCYEHGEGWYTRELQNEGEEQYVRYSANDASSCESVYVGNSEILASGGKLRLKSRNIEGRPIKICLRHDPPGDCLVEEIVSVSREWGWSEYSLPPVTRVGDIYFEVDNYAVGNETRTNDIAEASIVMRNSENRSNILLSENKKVYVNNQSHRDGWIAWSDGWIEHVKVNGWQNGWLVEGDSEQITIFYWPQLLEYVGFVMLGVTVWWLVKMKDE